MMKIFYVFFLGLLLVSCRTDQDVAKAREQGRIEGENIGYRNGYSVGIKKAETDWIEKGKVLGDADGYKRGKEDGEELGFDRGLIMGKIEGEESGYKKGLLSFVKGSWKPTIGAAIVAILTLLLIGILNIFFKTIFSDIKSAYSLKVRKQSLIAGILKRNIDTYNSDETFYEYLNKDLEKTRKRLNEINIERFKDNILEAHKNSYFDGVKRIVNYKSEIVMIDDVIKKIQNEVIKDQIIRRETLIKSVINGVFLDSKLSKADKEYILNKLNSDE